MSRCRAIAPPRLTPLAIASAAVERALRLLPHLGRHLDPLFTCRVAALSRRRVSHRSPSPQLQSSVRFFFFFISIVISILSSYVASRRYRAAPSHAARHRLRCSRARSS